MYLMYMGKLCALLGYVLNLLHIKPNLAHLPTFSTMF